MARVDAVTHHAPVPKLHLTLDEGRRANLEVAWVSGYPWLHVLLDGKQILDFDGKSELLRGKSVVLPDGSTLSVRLTPSELFPAVEVLRNGDPLPGSPTHQNVSLKRGATLLFAIAAFNVLAVFAASRDKAEVIDGLVEAVIFALLAFVTQRGKRWALILGAGLYALESVLGLLVIVRDTSTTPYAFLTFVVVRAVFLTGLGRVLLASG